MKEEKHWNWKGGRTICRGYILEMSKGHPRANKDGYVPEQVLIMERHIKRQINKNEVVHHINEIKHDNRIENLKLMTKNEHCSLHAKVNNHQRKGTHYTKKRNRA